MKSEWIYTSLKWLSYAAFGLAIIDVIVIIVAAILPNVSGVIQGILATVTTFILGLIMYAIVDLKVRIDKRNK